MFNEVTRVGSLNTNTTLNKDTKKLILNLAINLKNILLKDNVKTGILKEVINNIQKLTNNNNHKISNQLNDEITTIRKKLSSEIKNENDVIKNLETIDKFLLCCFLLSIHSNKRLFITNTASINLLLSSLNKEDAQHQTPNEQAISRETLRDLTREIIDMFPSANLANTQNPIQKSINFELRDEIITKGREKTYEKFFNPDINIKHFEINTNFSLENLRVGNSEYKCRINFNYNNIDQNTANLLVEFCINKLKEKNSKLTNFKVISAITLIDEINANDEVKFVFATQHQYCNNQITIYLIKNIINENEIIELSKELDSELINFLSSNNINWKKIIPTKNNILYDQQIDSCHFVSYRNELENIFKENVNCYNINDNKTEIQNNLLRKINLFLKKSIENNEGELSSTLNDIKSKLKKNNLHIEKLKYLIIYASNYCNIRLKDLIEDRFIINVFSNVNLVNIQNPIKESNDKPTNVNTFLFPGLQPYKMEFTSTSLDKNMLVHLRNKCYSKALEKFNNEDIAVTLSENKWNINFSLKLNSDSSYSKIKGRINFNQEEINQNVINLLIGLCINKLKENDSNLKAFKILFPIISLDEIKNKNELKEFFSPNHQYCDNQITLYFYQMDEYKIKDFCSNLDLELKTFFKEYNIDWNLFKPTEKNFLFDRKVPNCDFVSYRSESENYAGENISKYNINVSNAKEIKQNLINKIYDMIVDTQDIEKLGTLKNKMKNIGTINSIETLQYNIITLSNLYKLKLKDLIDDKYLKNPIVANIE